MYIMSLEQVLDIHQDIITYTGGSYGVRDMKILKSALTQPLMKCIMEKTCKSKSFR